VSRHVAGVIVPAREPESFEMERGGGDVPGDSPVGRARFDASHAVAAAEHMP